MLVGVAVAIGTLAYVKRYTDLSGLLYGAVGMTVCFVVGWIASVALPGEPETRDGLTIATLKE